MNPQDDCRFEVSLTFAEILHACIKYQLYLCTQEQLHLSPFVSNLPCIAQDMFRKNIYSIPKRVMYSLKKDIYYNRKYMKKYLKCCKSRMGVIVPSPKLMFRCTFSFESLHPYERPQNDMRELGNTLGMVQFVNRWMSTTTDICNLIDHKDCIIFLENFCKNTARYMMMATISVARLRVWILFKYGMWDDMNFFKDDGSPNISPEQVYTMKHTPQFIWEVIRRISDVYKNLCSRWIVLCYMFRMVELGTMCGIANISIDKYTRKFPSKKTFEMPLMFAKKVDKSENNITLCPDDSEIMRTSYVLYKYLVRFFFDTDLIQANTTIGLRDHHCVVKTVFRLLNITIKEKDILKIIQSLKHPGKVVVSAHEVVQQ